MFHRKFFFYYSSLGVIRNRRDKPGSKYLDSSQTNEISSDSCYAIQLLYLSNPTSAMLHVSVCVCVCECQLKSEKNKK